MLCMCVALHMSSSPTEKVLPPPKRPNVFLIMFKCHEKIQGEAVARPDVVFGPWRTKKSSQLEQKVQPVVSLLERENLRGVVEGWVV